ncbi:MAG: hypothetical protein V4532_07455, partial [Pseudomonadota bacterium]
YFFHQLLFGALIGLVLMFRSKRYLGD